MPFAFEVTSQLPGEDNLLVVRGDGRLGRDTVPPGNLALEDTVSAATPYPATSFDFFPFCGIHPPVLLYAVPRGAPTDVTVMTDVLGGDTGQLEMQPNYATQEDVTAGPYLIGHGGDITHGVPQPLLRVVQSMRAVKGWLPPSGS